MPRRPSSAISVADVEVLRRLAPGTSCLFVANDGRFVPHGDDVLYIDPEGAFRTLIHGTTADTLDRICFLAAHKNEMVSEQLPIPQDSGFRLFDVVATPVWTDHPAGEVIVGVLCTGTVVERRSLFGLAGGLGPQELLEAYEEDRFAIRYEPIHNPLTRQLRGVSAGVVLVPGDDAPGGPEISMPDMVPGLRAAGLLPDLETRLLVEASEQVSLWNRATQSSLSLVCGNHGPQVETGDMIRTVRLALSMSGLAPELFTLQIPGWLAVRPAAISVTMHLAGFGISTGVLDLLAGHIDLPAFKALRGARFTVPAAATGGVLSNFDQALGLCAMWVARTDAELCVAGAVDANDLSLLARSGVARATGPVFSEPMSAEAFDDYLSDVARSLG